MRILALVMLGAVLAACARHRAPSTRGAAGVPPGCSPMHGGIPETSAKPPVWRRGAQFSATQNDSAHVVVRVVRALDDMPLADARVIFGGPPQPVDAAATDASGYSAVHLRVGRTPVRALRLAHKRFTDTVTVRSGFADTLLLSLGTDGICFT